MCILNKKVGSTLSYSMHNQITYILYWYCKKIIHWTLKECLRSVGNIHWWNWYFKVMSVVTIMIIKCNVLLFSLHKKGDSDLNFFKLQFIFYLRLSPITFNCQLSTLLLFYKSMRTAIILILPVVPESFPFSNWNL